MFLSFLFFGPQFEPNRSQRIRVLYYESAPLEGKPLSQGLRWRSADLWVDFILRGCKGDIPFVVPELSPWTLDWILPTPSALINSLALPLFQNPLHSLPWFCRIFYRMLWKRRAKQNGKFSLKRELNHCWMIIQFRFKIKSNAKRLKKQHEKLPARRNSE